PAGARQAVGRFELTPVADADQEGAETVTVSGSAVQGGVALPVAGATVTIDDAARRALTVAKPANGRITGLGIDCGGEGADCSESHPDGTAVTLAATPDSGHLLRGWTGDCSGTGDCALSMDADKAVGASFAAERALTVAKPSNGKVTGTANGAAVIDCGADCAETLVDGTVVALRAAAAGGHRFDAWGGACASEATASCSVTLDADKSVSVAFASTVCAAGDRRWTAGGNACAGSVTGAASGQTRTATDGDDPTRGSASFKCEAGAWVEQAGATCTVDLSCGAAANACLTPGVGVRNPSATAAVDGACASTESAGCLKGTTYSNRPDIELKDGECGLKKDECVNGTFADRDDTDSEYRWRCEGIDAEDRWSCLGVAGSRNWSCSYANQSKACGVPIAAKDDNTCGDGEVTQEASDSPLCVLCKDGYETHGGACVAECGANEVRGTDGKCVCETGLSRVNGKCVKLHRLTVEVDPWRKGTVTSSDTTSRNFSCSTSCYTHVEDDKDVTLSVSSETGYSCELSEDSFKMTSEKTVTATCGCATGYEKVGNACLPACGATEMTCALAGATAAQAADSLSPPVNKWTCSIGGLTNNCEDRAPPPTCEADEHYALDGSDELVCIPNPYCPTPLNENECGPATATLIEVADTVVHGKRHGTMAEGCELGQYFAETDKAPQHGMCGSKVNQCGHGIEAANKSETTSAYRWDCGGVAGVGDHWGCRGTDGHLKWQCRSGLKTESCQIAETGTDSEAKTALPANTAKCLKCKDGYAEENGVCKKLPQPPMCGETELACKPGTAKQAPDSLKPPVNKWTCSKGGKTNNCEDPAPPPTCGPNEELALDASDELYCKCVQDYVRIGGSCVEKLKVNPGGPYTAIAVRLPVLVGEPPRVVRWRTDYFANVTASASGGTGDYEFQWENQPTGPKVVYVYSNLRSFPATQEVLVTDRGKPPQKARGDATINQPAAAGAARGATDGDGEFAFEVPLGAELYFVWGGEGDVTARSADEKVAGVSVSSPALRVVGVGLGETHVILVAGGEELALPVAVR
ncbi:MAG: hypothetical protein OXJ53_01965, partial [Gammaproteobacteria bacterium]|nr:hypothetical protein [Gammaproteobacteria bacterium]